MKKRTFIFWEIFLGIIAIGGLFDDTNALSIIDKTITIVFIILIMVVIYLVYSKKNNSEKNREDLPLNSIVFQEKIIISEKKENIIEYILKPFLTHAEINFYNKIKELNSVYIIVPQVNLGSFIDKINGKYRNELFRNIDFGIFSKDFKLLLLIELNDESHNKYNRKDRDLKVKKILDDCNIKLLTFYTKYPNEKEYVINRIKTILEGNNVKQESN